MAALVQEDDCGVCKKPVKEADNGLKCDSCDAWFHAGCEKVNKDCYLFLVKFKDQLWLCRKCKPEIKNAVHKVKELRKEVEDLRKELQDIKAEMISEVCYTIAAVDSSIMATAVVNKGKKKTEICGHCQTRVNDGICCDCCGF